MLVVTIPRLVVSHSCPQLVVQVALFAARILYQADHDHDDVNLLLSWCATEIGKKTTLFELFYS